jgi:PII-like signaling protein
MTDRTLEGEGLLLRIFIGEDDRWHGKALYEAILLLAKERGLAGCTVTRGLAGFGAASRIHTAKIERLSMDLPIVVEIVDAPDKVRALLPDIEEMVEDGLATLEPVEVHFYRHKQH